MDKSFSILTTQSKNVFKVGTVQTMMSEFNCKSDEFYYSDEVTKQALKVTHLIKKKNSLDKALEYHDFIKEHQAVTTKEKKNLTLKL